MVQRIQNNMNQFPSDSPILRAKDSKEPSCIEDEVTYEFLSKRSSLTKRRALEKRCLLSSLLGLVAILMVSQTLLMKEGLFSEQFQQVATNVLNTFDPLKSLIVQVRAQDQIVKCATPGGAEIDCSQADEKTVFTCTSMKGKVETCILNDGNDDGQVDKCATPGRSSDKDCKQADEKSICINKAGETVTCQNEGSGDDQDDLKDNSLDEINQTFFDADGTDTVKVDRGDISYKPYCEEKSDPVFMNDWTVLHLNEVSFPITCEESDINSSVLCFSFQTGKGEPCPDFSVSPYITWRTTCKNRENVVLDCDDLDVLDFYTVLSTCIDENNAIVPCNDKDDRVREVCASYQFEGTDSSDGHFMPFCPWDLNFDPEWSICDYCDIPQGQLDQSQLLEPSVNDYGSRICDCSEKFKRIDSQSMIENYVETEFGLSWEYDFSLVHNCDDKTNYGGIFDYIMHCTYNKNNFKGSWLTVPDGESKYFNRHQNLPKADCENDAYCYAGSQWDEDRDPCLLYYESQICARCKFGAVRIITENGVFCGYVDEDNFYYNQKSTKSLRCIVDKYYDNVFDPEITLTYELNNRYQNHTNNKIENICVQNDNFAGYQDDCELYDQFMDDSVWNSYDYDDPYYRLWNSIAGGCRVCNDDQNFYLVAEFQPQIGIYYLVCEYTNFLDEDPEASDISFENDICDNGEILIQTGVIPSENILLCKICEDLIPNCLDCDSAENCIFCKGGFTRTEITDSFGNQNVVCVWDFCGFYGEGSGCNGQVNLEGCEKSASLSVKDAQKQNIKVENCIRCAPGYHLVANENLQLSSLTLYLCKPSVDKVQLNFFVAPFDSTGTDSHLQDFQYQKSSEKGKSITDPIYSIQQALSNFQEGDGTDTGIDINSYSEAVVTLYLFKGVHHYINCQDFDQIDNIAIRDHIDRYAFLCFNITEQENCTANSSNKFQEESTCDYVFPENYENLVSTPYVSDNLKLSIVSMDCRYVDSYLIGMTGLDLEAFQENCIDVESGDKAQIRIANEYTYFNITNFAEFKDIEFTGEDLFASATYQGEEMGYMGQYGILAFMPFTKCTVREDAKNLSTIDDIFIKQMNHITIQDLEYECLDGFQKSENEPPSEKDDQCIPEEYQPEPNSNKCSGEPYHEDFFEMSSTNNYFTKRHKVLFNLYSFDSLRTTKTSPPELKITNCRFKFFVDKTDALIQVENNNLGYLGEIHEDIDNRFLSYYGEDRGAKITIEDSEFYSNSFCKGLIYYNRFQTISFSEQQNLLNFTANAVQKSEVFYKEKAENFIRIKNSEFKNSGFHQVIQAVNLDKNNLMESAEEFFDVSFNRFQDQGLIVNTNGYSGSIEVSGSSFFKSIAYIQEILITESSKLDTKYDIDDLRMITDFSNTEETSLFFKQCTDYDNPTRYFFQEVINPDTEFDDAVIVETVENVSPFVIKGNRGPMIFVNNTFSESIGMTGGVIHIENPDFRYGDNPYIVMKQNKFMNNMAYWAGNAFHIQMKVRMYYGQATRKDSWQTCGAGILIEDNFFINNVGLKRHNGGAGVIRCQHTLSTYEDMFTYLSGKERSFNTNGYRIWLDDPRIHKSIVVDIVDPFIEYEVLTYGTLIKDNTFSGNYSGKRGTALLTELVNELQIESNQFTQNGPVHTYREIANSPYYKNFLYNKRTLSYHLHEQDLGNCIDEADWFNRCYKPGYEIDMPQVQGAVYIKNCHTELTCWFIEQDKEAAVAIFSIQNAKRVAFDFRTEEARFIVPWQSVQIKENLFYDNHANIVMFDSQKQPQASSLFIFGGRKTIISGNEFTGHRNWADVYMKSFAYDIYNYMPPNYFKYSQAAMIRVEYPDTKVAYTDIKTDGRSKPVMLTELSNNLISDNINMQVVTYRALEYKASILEFDCQMPSAVLSINDNEIKRNQFIGKESTLFFINGGIASVNNNDFSYNGMLTITERSQSTANFTREYSRSEFPWEDYSFTEAQERGIFTFEFFYSDVPIKKAHSFKNNIFRHIYCQVGCAYHVTGTKIQQYSFLNNTYNFLISSKGSAVFYGSVNLEPNDELDQVWTQSYRNETFDRIFGGSLQLTGNNVPITIIENSKFINNFGLEGAAINFERGGGLYITESSFQFDYQIEALEQNLDFTKMEELISQIAASFIPEIFSSYEDRVSQSFIFDQESLDKSTLRNNQGQISIQKSKSTIRNMNQPVVGFSKKKMSDLILDIWKLDLYSNSNLAIKDSLFQNNFGLFVSAITLESSSLSLIGTNEKINFVQNIAASLGSTIQATNSNIDSTGMFFMRNKGQDGACYHLTQRSELIDVGSSYSNNIAQKGGVTYAITLSKVKHELCNFDYNQADVGAVLYALFNTLPDSLSYKNCQFKKNTAGQSLVQLINSYATFEDSVFLDNSATRVTHGFTMISSNLNFFNSTVNFSEGFADKLRLEKLDTAFFNLYLGSSIEMGRNTTISNLVALNQAVLSAYSLSNVNIHSGVVFINNTALSSTGQTILLQNTDKVTIDDAYFENNQQTNVQIDLGQMKVINSYFTNGRANHILAQNSGVTLDNVNIHDSYSEKKSGCGFFCNRCYFVYVENSNFKNLETGEEGGAIKLSKLFNSTEYPVSYIRNNTFINNKAKSGGAIVLDRPNLLEVSDNIFTNNNATSAENGSGGAILYRCDPTTLEGLYNCTVSLTGNTFNGNQASRTGGAIRYENANFTDIRLLPVNGRTLQQSSSRNFFSNNKADYGNNIASFPSSISYSVLDKDSGAYIDESLNQIEIASGQNFQFEIIVLDQEGRIYTDDNKAIVKIVFESPEDVGPNAFMLGTEAVAKNGKFVFNSFQVQIKPSTSANITFEFTGLDNFGTSIEFLEDFRVFTVKARTCQQGEYYTEDLKCMPCPVNFYLYEAQLKPGRCKKCDFNAFCYGMNNTAPSPGYWRSGPTLEVFTPCLRPESCLGGGKQKYPLGICETGYTGILCNDCKEGYFRSAKACSLCPDLFWNVALFVLLMIGLVLVVMFIVRSIINGLETTKSLHQGYLKIFMNHIQVMAMITSIDFKWPKFIQTILESQQSVADSPSQILSFDCLLNNLLGEPTMLRSIYRRLIIYACLPFIVQFLSVFFWFLYGLCKSIPLQEKFDKARATTIIVSFLFYPTIVSVIAKQIKCIEIEGEMRLLDDLEEICFQGTHMLMLLTVTIPSLIAWAIGIPIYTIIKLFANRKAIENIKEFDTVDGRYHAILMRQFKTRLGFLIEGYQEKYFYWENILLIRKSILVLLIEFFSLFSSGMQSLVLIWAITICLLIHMRIQPYHDDALNKMETLSLSVIIATIYMGLFYQTDSGKALDNQIVSWVFFLAVLVPSILFALNFVKKIWLELLKQAATKSPLLFRYMTCGFVSRQKFKVRHMTEYDGEDELEITSKIQDKPKSKDLVGFKVQKDQHVNEIKKCIEKRRQEKRKTMETERDESIMVADKKVRDGKKSKNAGESFLDMSIFCSEDQVSNNYGTNENMLTNYENQGQTVRHRSDPKFIPTLKTNGKKIIVQNNKTDPFLSQIKLKKTQNFEYKEEIEFRDEEIQGSTTSKLIKNRPINQQSPNRDDNLKIPSKKQLRKTLKQSGNNDKFDGSKSSIYKAKFKENTTKITETEQFSTMLDEQDNDKLKSRNFQKQIKSGLFKSAGLTMANINEDSPSEAQSIESVRNRQVQSQLEPTTLPKLQRGKQAKKSSVKRKKEKNQGSGGVCTEENAHKEVRFKQISNASDQAGEENGSTNPTSQQNKILEKKRVAKSSPTREQILKTPRLLFAKRRNPAPSKDSQDQKNNLRVNETETISKEKGENVQNLDHAIDYEDFQLVKPVKLFRQEIKQPQPKKNMLQGDDDSIEHPDVNLDAPILKRKNEARDQSPPIERGQKSSRGLLDCEKPQPPVKRKKPIVKVVDVNDFDAQLNDSDEEEAFARVTIDQTTINKDQISLKKEPSAIIGDPIDADEEGKPGRTIKEKQPNKKDSIQAPAFSSMQQKSQKMIHEYGQDDEAEEIKAKTGKPKTAGKKRKRVKKNKKATLPIKMLFSERPDDLPSADAISVDIE